MSPENPEGQVAFFNKIRGHELAKKAEIGNMTEYLTRFAQQMKGEQDLRTLPEILPEEDLQLGLVFYDDKDKNAMPVLGITLYQGSDKSLLALTLSNQIVYMVPTMSEDHPDDHTLQILDDHLEHIAHWLVYDQVLDTQTLAEHFDASFSFAAQRIQTAQQE